MRNEPDAVLVAALERALRDEAERVQPSPDAWATVQARLRAADLQAGSDGTRSTPGRPRSAWRGRAAALVAVGLVVAVLVLVTTTGLRRTATPGPVETPSAVDTPGSTTSASASSTPAVGTGYRPSRPRATWTVYRPGPQGLYVDAVRATAPYDPVQAMDALFRSPPTVAGAEVLPGEERNQVASLVYADGLAHLDMASVDEQTRPAGREGAARARRWVEAWARTAAAALGGAGPVTITLHGRPTTLYGVVDTTQPVRDFTIQEQHPATVFLPARSAAVTSPVTVAAMPGAVGDRLVVDDVRTGATVATLTADAAGGGETVLSAAPELAPGDYTVSLLARSGRVEEQHPFTVTGTAPTGTREPVTDPPTTPVTTTLVYYPGPAGHLLAEPRPRTTLAAAVAATGGEPAGEDASWPFGSLTVASVEERDGTVVVDYASDDKIRPGHPDAAVAAFWAQSLVHTVAAYEGRPVPVAVTLHGRPFRLFGLLDTTEAFTFRTVETRTTAALALPTGVPAPAPLEVVGGVDPGVARVTWYLDDRVSQETLFRGRAAVSADLTYAFALPVAPGRYVLRVDAVTDGGRVRSYGGAVEVS